MKANDTHHNPVAAAARWLRGTVATPTQDGLLDRTLQARRDGILEEPMGDKLIIFDSSTRRSVSLDAAAAFVWRHCDGGTRVAEIAAAHGHGEAEVLRALGVLAESGLLLEYISIPTGHSRRNFLTYGGRAAGLALIGSLVAAPRSLAGGKGKGHNNHGNGNGYGHDKGKGKGHDKHHAVDCGGVWSEWDTCSASCGGGTQARTFTVLTPAANGGAACPVSPETRDCNTQACQADPVDCEGTWGQYSQCSVSCGGGTRSREFIVTTPAANGGAACPVSPETVACNSTPCDFQTCTDCDAIYSTCDNGVCTHGCNPATYDSSCCYIVGGAWFDDC